MYGQPARSRSREHPCDVTDLEMHHLQRGRFRLPRRVRA